MTPAQKDQVLLWLHASLEPLYRIAKDNRLAKTFHDINDVEVGMQQRLSDICADDYTQPAKPRSESDQYIDLVRLNMANKERDEAYAESRELRKQLYDELRNNSTLRAQNLRLLEPQVNVADLKPKTREHFYSVQRERELSRQQINIIDEKGANINLAEPPAMRLPNIDTHTPVVVTWEDANTTAGDEHTTIGEALSSYKPLLRKTIGFWVGISKSAQRVATIVACDDDRDNESAVSGLSIIPLGMVTAIHKLDQPEAVWPL